MSDEKKLDGELKEGAAARGERELGENAQAVGDPRGERLRASSAGDDKVLRMGTASIPRLITEFAIPSVVGMLINGSYAIIDSVFLGHAVGEIGLSAMTVANPIMIVFMAIAMLIGNGGNALAAIGVVQRIGQFSVMPLIGIAIALQPLLGFNYGAHNVERVRKTLWYGIGAASSISLLMFVIVEVFAVPIAHAFGISHDGLVDFTAFAIRVQFLMLPFVGFQIVSSNYFQATGQPAKSVFLTLTRQILFLVPLLYLMPVVLPQLFPQFTGLDALYFAAPVADFLSIFTTAVFVAWEMARLRRLSAMYA